VCKEILELIVALTQLARTFNKILRREVEIPTPMKSAFGKTITIDEDTEMSTMKYKQMLGPLPDATGPNKDIVSVMFRVDLDGAEGAPFEVPEFDKESRQYIGDGVAWDSKKGADVKLSLAYKDDDDNIGDYTTFDFGVARDTIRPDAPTTNALGATVVLDEVEDEVPPTE
jgi:hypothetical protein